MEMIQSKAWGDPALSTKPFRIVVPSNSEKRLTKCWAEVISKSHTLGEALNPPDRPLVIPASSAPGLPQHPADW